MIKLSIITVNLNNSKGLRKTIESVVSQTSNDFEYIIIDGGSTDSSLKVIEELSYRITYWISESDKGIYNAMNKGILQAKGEYCQFLNSGDWLADNWVIDKMIKTLPNCSIYYGNMLKQMPDGTAFCDKCEEGNITMYSLFRGSLNHSPAFIKRSLFDKYGLYDETLRIVSDWKWYLITVGINNESVKYTNTNVTCFDMSGISNTNGFLEKQERQAVLGQILPVNILKDYNKHWQNIEQAERINSYRISRILFWLVDRILFKLEKFKSRKTK
jgi:glycosyltransferase involved in cell wall biosynthesis